MKVIFKGGEQFLRVNRRIVTWVWWFKGKNILYNKHYTFLDGESKVCLNRRRKAFTFKTLKGSAIVCNQSQVENVVETPLQTDSN